MDNSKKRKKKGEGDEWENNKATATNYHFEVNPNHWPKG